MIYYHIKDALKETGEVVPAGYGDARLQEMLQQLANNNDQSFLSLEPHLGLFEGFESLENNSNTINLLSKVTSINPYTVNKEGTFKEKSDASKFKLAHKCLMVLLEKTKKLNNG